MIVEIEWIERTSRYVNVEVDSIEELSHLKNIDNYSFGLFRTGKENWIKLEDNSIKYREVKGAEQ